MANNPKGFEITGGDSIGGSLFYTVGEVVEINGGRTTKPTASAPDLKRLDAILDTRVIVIGKPIAEGTRLRIEGETPEEVDELKADDAIGGDILYERGKRLEVTGGKTSGMKAEMRVVQRVAEKMDVKRVKINPANSDGAQVHGPRGEGDE